MTAINRWILSTQNRCANIWYNQNYTVYGLNPVPGMQAPSDANIVTLQDLGNGTIALQCGGGYNAFASVRDDYGYQVQFQAPNGTWIGQVGGDETLQAIPTGDGYFALYSPTFGRYVTINPSPDAQAQNCNPLVASAFDLGSAARFTATGLDRNSILDFLQVSKNATGLSFAGVNLANCDLSNNNLSLCDFRGVASLNGGVLDGANLQQACFASLHVAGLQISGADCTGADFTGCDFTSFAPGTPPPVLDHADLTGAVVPAGISWSGANMPGAVLAEANLTGCDLSGTATDLTGANFSGLGVTLFTPVYHQGDPGSGIDGYDLASPADRVIACDYDGTGNLDHLVCYRPGTGTIWILKKTSDNDSPNAFAPVYQGGGIGGYNLASPADRVIACDYDGTGNVDHLVCYRPGTGTIWILKKTSDNNSPDAFAPVYHQGDPGSGIGGYDLASPADRVIAYDYDGTGNLDHLVCYRPGTGTIWILKKTSDNDSPNAFAPVYQGGGIGGYNLASPADRVIAYDYDGTGNLDHLVCYRPGTGTIWILKKTSDTNSPDAFAPVYHQGDPGSGIGGYNLGSPADRVIAYDYDGTGNLDHLVCYRPPTGTIWILKKTSDNDSPDAFTPVYNKRSGIGGYNLASAADRVIAYDYEGTGHPNYPVCYRPGTGTIWILKKGAAGPATLGRCNLSKVNLSTANLVGLDLTTIASLVGANLSGTQLPGTKLAGVDLTGTVLVGTNFTGTDLTSVRFSSPLTRSTDPNNPTIFASCTLPYAVIGLDWSCLDLTSTTIVGVPTDSKGRVDLTGLVAMGMRRPLGDFGGFVLDQANFANATLDGADFSHATLQLAHFDEARLMSAKFTRAVLDQTTFVGSALGGVQDSPAADFTFAFISNCDFSQANLYGVTFAGATLISQNKLRGATNLQQTDFSNAYLPYADFTRANLQGAKFDGAFMVECVLTDAVLSSAEQGAIRASLTSACLQGANFYRTNLADADLANAAITDQSGEIMQQYYGEDGTLTEMWPMRYKVSSFPAAASFSNQTICPNTDTYGLNVEDGLTIAQMMAAPNPPTQWSPPGAAESTTTSLSSSPSPSHYGDEVVLTAVVTSASGGAVTGTVEFLDGGSSIGTANLSGTEAYISTSALSAGTHSLTAHYQGTASYAASTSTVVEQTVLPALIATSVVLISAPNPSTAGQAIDFTATVTVTGGGTPTGSVTISETAGGGSTTYGSGNLSNGVAVIQVSNLAEGSHPFMYATYGGDATHDGATSPAYSQQVNAS